MPEAVRRSRKFPWLVVGVLALVAAGAVGYAVYGLPGLSFGTSPVDRWKAASPDNRKEVAEALIDRKTLIGKSRDEVLRDLGPADRVDEEQGIYQWRVGVETKMGRDANDRPALQDETQYLKVKFNDGVATVVNLMLDITAHL